MIPTAPEFERADRRKNPPSRPPCENYQARVQAGYCVRCNERATPGSPLCLHHATRHRERFRAKNKSTKRYLKAKSYQQEQP